MSCPLFGDRDANLPEARLDVSHLGRPERARPSGQALDLTGKPKAIMAIGLGATGKTTLLRWLCERALERNDDELALATVDPVNRELGHYFPAAMAPPTQDPAQVTAWLEQLLAMIMETRKSVALDFGGGDTTLGPAPDGSARPSADDGKRRRRARGALSPDTAQQRPDTTCRDDAGRIPAESDGADPQ